MVVGSGRQVQSWAALREGGGRGRGARRETEVRPPEEAGAGAKGPVTRQVEGARSDPGDAGVGLCWGRRVPPPDAPKVWAGGVLSYQGRFPRH